MRRDKDPMNSEQRAWLIGLITVGVLLTGMITFGIYQGAESNKRNDQYRAEKLTKCAEEGNTAKCLLAFDMVKSCEKLSNDDDSDVINDEMSEQACMIKIGESLDGG